MNNFDKEEYKLLKEDADVMNVYTYHLKNSEDSSLVNRYTGLTIAFQVCAPNSEDPRMLRVAVSYCAPEDKFKKKIGRYNVLCKFFDGQYVQLPLAEYFYDNGEEETGDLLTHIFSV